jgi:hypothetical protein
VDTLDLWQFYPPTRVVLPVLGGALARLGLVLTVASIRRFLTVGKGTHAPWEPPPRLMVRGIDRHVRNPMIPVVAGLVDNVFVGEVTQPQTLRGLCDGIEVVFSSLGITRQTGFLTWRSITRATAISSTWPFWQSQGEQSPHCGSRTSYPPHRGARLNCPRRQRKAVQAPASSRRSSRTTSKAVTTPTRTPPSSTT